MKRCPATKKVGQRRILLGCWGSFNDPDVCDYTYKNMTEWGEEMFVTPGVVVDGEAGHHRPGRHQPRTSAFCWAAPTTTTGRTARPS